MEGRTEDGRPPLQDLVMRMRMRMMRGVVAATWANARDTSTVIDRRYRTLVVG
jgi:hypothetical protein